MVPVALSLAVLLAAPFARAASTLPTPPSALRLDGAVGEWTQPPTWTLGASDQVAGWDRPSGPADVAVRAWLAWDADGFVLAVDVTDDRYVPAGSSNPLDSDHVELWVGLPQPALPAIGFANQFGEQLLPTAERCDAPGDFPIDDPAACKRWWKEQAARHKRLERAFTRQYLFSPAGVTEAFSEPSTKEVQGAPPCCAASEVHLQTREGGWTMEARIRAADLPATGAWPLAEAAVLVDVVDDDVPEGAGGRTGQEVFLSSRKGRKWGDPTTFERVGLPVPLAPAGDPPLLASLLTAKPPADSDGEDVLFWYPTTPPRLFGAVNMPQGYQYSPTSPSPEVFPVDLATARKVATYGRHDLWTGPVAGPLSRLPWSTQGLWVVEAGRVVAFQDLWEAEVVATAEKAPGLHVLVREQSTGSYLGAGQCGACPRVSWTLYTMDASGALVEACGDDEMEGNTLFDGEGSDGYYLEDLSVTWTATLDRIALTARRSGDDGTPGAPWTRETAWDPKAGKCVPER